MERREGVKIKTVWGEKKSVYIERTAKKRDAKGKSNKRSFCQDSTEKLYYSRKAERG